MLKKNSKNVHKTLSFILIPLLLLSLNSCSKPDWGKTAEPDGRKRAQQNVIEGRGLQSTLFKNKGGGGGNFTFASSNPLWRASLDTLDFLVLSNVDYSGGLIISDWYSENNQNEAVKITLRFLSNEIRADAINVIVHKRSCVNLNCTTKKITSDLELEIKDKILQRAAYYSKIDEDQEIERRRKNPKKFKPL
ncbi:DUF3576 domain-containing protein [Candidatus Pelagibacter sp.]|nr:DUF3576 domain-containing protein [Candidatus Pelagibacter sp.]